MASSISGIVLFLVGSYGTTNVSSNIHQHQFAGNLLVCKHDLHVSFFFLLFELLIEFNTCLIKQINQSHSSSSITTTYCCPLIVANVLSTFAGFQVHLPCFFTRQYSLAMYTPCIHTDINYSVRYSYALYKSYANIAAPTTGITRRPILPPTLKPMPSLPLI